MKKIAVIIADMFEDAEYTQPAEAFQKAGYELVHIGLKRNETVRGKKKDTPVTIDRAVDEVSPDAFDGRPDPAILPPFRPDRPGSGRAAPRGAPPASRPALPPFPPPG